MPQRAKAPIGAPTWIDLMTSDPELTRPFYGELFGWTSTEPDPEYGGYINFLRDGVPVAGCMQSQPEFGVPDVWSIYLASADAKATTDAAEAHGGAVVVPAMDVADLGRMALVTDPGGAAIGVWEPGAHPVLRVLTSRAPGWFELHTRDYDAVRPFYTATFSAGTCTPRPTRPVFRYATLGEGDGQLAGIMDPAATSCRGRTRPLVGLLQRRERRTAIDAIVRLGGSVVHPAEDTPYGRLATVADPAGAVFKLIER